MGPPPTEIEGGLERGTIAHLGDLPKKTVSLELPKNNPISLPKPPK
jgi:hypothetical protein